MSSSWGNGHATLWRGLCKYLIRRGHDLTFFERNTSYYASYRDCMEFPGMDLIIYSEWNDIVSLAQRHLQDSDVAIITSYCPDSQAATRIIFDSAVKLRVFYDLDAPVTLEKLSQKKTVEYVPEGGFKDFDLVLSYTGGRTLDELRNCLGARNLAPLYGSVDPESHYPVAKRNEFTSDFSYLGTYARDRQEALEAFFLEPSRVLSERLFFLAGSMYPQDFPWSKNIFYREHIPPPDHSSFYCSSRLTLNITRQAMAKMGYCPSGRIFEAASCGVPILSDYWEGLEHFYALDTEILVARDTWSAVAAISLSDAELNRVSKVAREKTLDCHTALKRVIQLENHLELFLSATSSRFIPRSQEIRMGKQSIWGIVPSAGAGSRIQPLAFSKELLPVGSRVSGGIERPRAVSEFLIERMIRGGATQICFVISPGKSDILEYYGGQVESVDLCYTVQPSPSGLCDALFRSIPLIQPQDQVLIGLPDTVWFPEDGFCTLPDCTLSFLLFPVERPELFDAVVCDDLGKVLQIEVKKPKPKSQWIWGAFKMPGHVFHDLYRLWCEREKADEYMGTLVNEYILRGGEVQGVRAGETYVDVGTLHGYREAIQALAEQKITSHINCKK